MAHVPPFDRLGPAEPASPVVLSVPHAGRDYPPALTDALAVAPDIARGLEDRHVDAVALAALGDETAFIARLPRAWIDLNRREDERDPMVDEGAPAGVPSAKSRGGLGLIPRRAAGGATLWRRRWTAAEVDARIAADHRPYHEALATALAAAHARFGTAVLLDLHSMPSLPGSRADVVLGDRHGLSAGGRFIAAVAAAATRASLRLVRNAPYAGGHITERHGKPALGVHAVQVEIDRTLYLDARGHPDGHGVTRLAAFLRDTMDALAREATGGVETAAAE